MGSEGYEDIGHHTAVTSQDGWLKAWNKYCGIALDGEDWCEVQHGRLTITPDGTGKKKNIVQLTFMTSLTRLIPRVINCHSNAFASSAKTWTTSFNFSFTIVH